MRGNHNETFLVRVKRLDSRALGTRAGWRVTSAPTLLQCMLENFGWTKTMSRRLDQFSSYDIVVSLAKSIQRKEGVRAGHSTLFLHRANSIGIPGHFCSCLNNLTYKLQIRISNDTLLYFTVTMMYFLEQRNDETPPDDADRSYEEK